MVNYCSVPECNSAAKKGSNVKFHRFPKDEKLRKEWVIRLRINKIPTKHFTVCSKHFEDSDYTVINTLTNFKILKKNTVPSLNLPIQSHEKVIRGRRILTRQKTEEPVAKKTDILNLPTVFVNASLKTNVGTKPSLKNCSTHFHPYASATKGTSTPEYFAGNNKKALKMVIPSMSIHSPNIPRPPIKHLVLLSEPDIQKDPLTPVSIKTEKNDSTTQTDKLHCEHAVQTDHEIEFVPTETMRYDELSVDDFIFFTGFTFPSFIELTTHLDIGSKSNKYITSLLNYDQLILTLIKLRHNFEFKILAKMYGIHQDKVREIFVLWINLMYDQFRKTDLWPKRRKRKSVYTAIVHCCEIPCQMSNSTSHDLLKSKKMKRPTFKYLVATNEHGMVIFCSNKLFGGAISNHQLIIQSGILAKLEKGDKVLLGFDFRFNDDDLLLFNGITFEQPHECSDEEKSREFVNRLATLTKKFKIIKGVFPATLMPYAGPIVFVTNVLVNFVT